MNAAPPAPEMLAAATIRAVGPVSKRQVVVRLEHRGVKQSGGHISHRVLRFPFFEGFPFRRHFLLEGREAYSGEDGSRVNLLVTFTPIPQARGTWARRLRRTAIM